MKFEWVVPVVVLIVWLISTILKSRDNDEPVRPKRPGGGDGRRPTSDIDRFLQEIDRLKRRSADERAEAVRPAPPPAPRPVQPVPRVRPVSKPVRLEAVPEVLVVEPPRVLKPMAPVPVGAYGSPPVAPKQPGVAQVSKVELGQAPGVAVALTLLRSPESVAGAVLLHEVLGPPKSRR